MFDFEAWNSDFGGKEMAEAIQEIKDSGGVGEYDDVPEGRYEVGVERVEFKSSRSGNPMLSIWYKIVEGDYKNSYLFQNQVMTKTYPIFLACETLSNLSDTEVTFDGDFEKFNDDVVEIYNKIHGNEYLIDYSLNKNGFPSFKILESY